jgi:DNA-binding transcriptional MerR regulator
MQEKAIVPQGRKTRVSSRRNIKSRLRSQQAIRLREAGLTHKQIAEQLGYANESGAYKAVTRELQILSNELGESREAVQTLELSRLNQMQSANWRSVLQGDTQAISTGIKIMERRSALLGLDAPRKEEIRMRVEVFSWNEAVRDILSAFKNIFGNDPRADQLIDEIDRLANERFAGVS